MLSPLAFSVSYLTTAITVLVVQQGGWWMFFPVLQVFAIIPLIDEIVGPWQGNPDPATEARITRSRPYRLLVWAWVPVQTALLVWSLGLVASGALAPHEIIGLTLAIGISTGTVGITFAHELMHRPGRFDRMLAELLMGSVLYAHFCIEHVHGHHRNVATRDDPATARLGESFYRFLPRTIVRGAQSAWRLERERRRRRGIPFWSLRNRMLRYGLLQTTFLVVVLAVFGPAGLLFFVAQALVAVTELEIINYLEHYGLARRIGGDGRPERVRPWHSWNSSHLVSNLFLINLARHSDHHFAAGRPYQLLRHWPDAPQLPGGYGAMFLAAMVPPLWFRIMNPRVAAWRARDLAGGEVPVAG
ncbi:alkane 1-monooxygenase [Oceanibacterium hippocampi]|uniref:Alkane 1-monooxygenase 1 n=1 Tax=Oceanibacterium hippocampi TaxID=745714 RepID=A0A1Y5T9Z1_9PROT|nr:alkane 1-monooxygenase [Oceanibacterium hippocampi]SLN55704.1 Alkane 1-monooxygenase 1 [Oceanibacterium hippocampi]